MTSNNQRLEKCSRFVLLFYNWNVRFFFFFTTYYAHDRNLLLLKFTVKQLVIEAKCVSHSKMAGKA